MMSAECSDYLNSTAGQGLFHEMDYHRLFQKYKRSCICLMDPVTAIQTGLYHSLYEYIIFINMAEW